MSVIETMTFELSPGVDPAEFLAADALVQERFSYQQPGLVRRTMARSDQGWLLLTIWSSDDAATSAGEAFIATDLSTDFNELIDDATIVIHRYSPARS